MAVLQEGITQRNIFDRFIAEYGCDITKLSQLMILIKGILTRAAQQKMTYHYFKGDEESATEGFKDVQTYFFKIRRAFEDRVWHCKSNSVDDAKKAAEKIVKQMKGFSQESIVQAIFNELKVKYPWYTWAVAAISDYRPNIPDLEWRGRAYFKVEDRSDPDKVKSYYVVYQDTKSSTTCIEIKQAKTLLVFKRCAGCNSDYICAADSIISNKKCTSSTLETLIHSYVPQNTNSLGFIAAEVSTIYTVCQYDTCNGHGACRQIPSTNTHQCICKRDYDGQFCEKWLDFDDSIEKMLSGLRKTFNIQNGLPTAVNVFFSIRSLSQSLKVALQKIKDSFAHTNNIIQSSQIISKVETIAELYGKLQKNELTFDKFGQHIDDYLRTVTTAYEAQNGLKRMILGQGILQTPGNDIYNSYKREYLSNNGGGCSARYNKDIKSFRDNLAYLDQALGEALLLHQKWLLETKGTTEALRTKYKKEAEDIQNIFKDRQQAYNQYWKYYSCGALKVDGMDISCQEDLTFEGMILTPSCKNHRQLNSNEVTCKKIGSVLKWDPWPKCKYVWGNWGDWSACTKTCNGGSKWRRRYCLGLKGYNRIYCIREQGGSDREAVVCETQDCCSDQYGKFQCPRKCIQKSSLCDGHNDCGGNEDESKSQCPNSIRSGDEIALRSHHGSGDNWLSCYRGKGERCTTRTCPGNDMEGNDWVTCSGEKFTIHKVYDIEFGPIVRNGDYVTLQYYGEPFQVINENYLKTVPCPPTCQRRSFQIFSVERQDPNCPNDYRETNFKCLGRPIQKNDNVFLLNPIIVRGYLTYPAKIRECPGYVITEDDKTNCREQLWTIIRRNDVLTSVKEILKGWRRKKK